MCGIVGVVIKATNGFNKRQEDVFYEMLFADTLRGYDSTGLICVHNNGKFIIAKEAVEATWFIPQVKNHKDMNGLWQNGKVLIGHNRKKTSGFVNDESAHPFVIDDTFAMVHNGTLYGHKKLADTEVDSEALATVFAEAFKEQNFKEKLNDTLGQVNGAYATASYDQRSHKVHLLRNKERPLSILETDDAWYFASESLMLVWIAARNGYDYAKMTGKITHCQEHMLYTFDLEKTILETEELSPKKATPSSTTSTSRGGRKIGTEVLTTKKEQGRFRKQWVGTRVRFFADDYFECYFPKTLESGETEITLMGDLDEIVVRHAVYADIDLAKFNMTKESDFIGKLWGGRVDKVEFYEGIAILTLEDVKPIVTALNVEARRAFMDDLRRCTLLELETRYEEEKHVLASWQLAAFSVIMKDKTEALKRAADKAFLYPSLQGAEAVARNKGETLTCKYNDKTKLWEYTDSKGVLYYADSSSVH